MSIERFYDVLPTLECLQGDTLGTIRIYPKGLESLEGCTMQVIIEDQNAAGTAIITKTADTLNDHFEMQITSDDTKSLSGTYHIHFRMTDASGFYYRRLAGLLLVRRTARGA